MLAQQLRQTLLSSNCTEQSIRDLIERGADPFVPNKNGDTSITIALNRGYPISIVKCLLPERLIPDDRINLVNNRGDSALSLSVLIYDSAKLDPELFRLLHDAGADFRTKLSGSRPLIATALRNKYTNKQIRELLKWSSRVEFEDVLEAIQRSRLDILNLLLDRITSEGVSNEDNLNCQQLDTALPNALALLIKHFDMNRTANHTQLVRIFQRLIVEFNADVNYNGPANPAPIHLLIMKHRKQFNPLIDLLMSRTDLDLNIVFNQLTPLEAALNRGLNRIAEKLILAGCCLFGTNVQNIILRPGCSVPLKLMFIHGFKLPDNVHKIGHFPPVKFYSDCDGSALISSRDKQRQDIERELSNLKKWLIERSGSNFPKLSVLAARVVRPLFERYTEEFRTKRYSEFFIDRFEQMVFLEQSCL